jgi:hypothetical protein
MTLQQQQLLTQLLFRNIELCLSNKKMPQILTSHLVLVTVMPSMTFNTLAGIYIYIVVVVVVHMPGSFALPAV